MNEMQEIYRKLLIKYYKNPYNSGLRNTGIQKESKNTSCGDDVIIEAVIKDNVIESIRNDAKGCMICISSASMLCKALEGKSVSEAKLICEEFSKMQKGAQYQESLLGELAIFKCLDSFPARKKCASLSFDAAVEIFMSI